MCRSLPNSSVVIVPSVGCDIKSWTYGDACWPKAVLPADLPYARVIEYHYQTDFAAFLRPDQSAMYDMAIKFLLSLLKIRANLPSDELVRGFHHIHVQTLTFCNRVADKADPFCCTLNWRYSC